MPSKTRVSVPHYHSGCDSVDTVKDTQRSFCSSSDRICSVRIGYLTMRGMSGRKLRWPSERGRQGNWKEIYNRRRHSRGFQHRICNPPEGFTATPAIFEIVGLHRRRLTYVTCPSLSNETQQIMTGAVIRIEQAPRSRLASRTNQNVGYTRKVPAFEGNAEIKPIECTAIHRRVNHRVCGIVEHEKVHTHVLVRLRKQLTESSSSIIFGDSCASLLTSRPNDSRAITASRLLAMTSTNFMYVSSCRQIHRARCSRGYLHIFQLCPVHLVPALTEGNLPPDSTPN
ncbi:hypothetical protein EDD17DRAFT_1583661 [Pisolithus thermaeus]|nr:hypothetical protein EDD17DRAFT_1583661 [Pisolithus thermaeus]